MRELQGKLHVCIEEGTWSEWLYEILSPHVAEVVVYRNEWTPGARSDAIDAHGLAEKLRIGQAGPGVFKAPKRYRKLREWAHVYQALTRDATRAKNRLKSQFARRGIRCTGSSVYDPQQRDGWLEQLPAAMRPTARLLGHPLREAYVPVRIRHQAADGEAHDRAQDRRDRAGHVEEGGSLSSRD